MRMAVIFNSDYHSWPMGGMITFIKDMISALSEAFEIELWGCAVDGQEPQPVSINGVSYPVFINSQAKSRRKLIPNVVKCFWGNMSSSRKFQADRYDILYFHLSASMLGWMLGNWLNGIFRKNQKKPLILFHQHGMAYGNDIGDRLNYYAMNKADVVFFTTDRESLERHKTHIQNPNVVWMPAMVDTDFFRPVGQEEKLILRQQLGLAPEAKVFVFTGRITEWKNPLLLLDAFEIYQKNNNHNGYLIYVGDGDSTPGLEKAVQEKGLTGSVRLAGRQDRQQIRACLQAADVFVLPSKGEGVSVSTLEAMASGLPAVAFRVEGMAGLVETSSGVLVDDRTAEGFAQGMEQALTMRQRLTPRTTAQKYSKEHIGKLMIETIRQAAAKGKQP